MTEPERTPFEKQRDREERILGKGLGCAFSLWGAFLNGWITSRLWDWHFGAWRMKLEVPYSSALLGLLLGFITSRILFSRNPRFALRSGYVFVFIVTVLFITDARSGVRLLIRFDEYAFSFLWALSLVVN